MFESTRRWFVSGVLLASLMGVTLCVVPAARAQDAKTIINDMTLPGDAAFHGVPSNYSWANGAPTPQPMPVPAKNWKGQWWQAATAWGQVYIPTEGSSATNTRCQIRNMVTKFLMSNGSWATVQSSVNPEGAAFVEDFANNASTGANYRDESANGGGLSMTVGVGNYAGHNYHFWPSGGRAFVDVNNVIGVYTACDARLIIDNPNGPDDRALCKNILQMGMDWWLDTSTGWLPDWSANSGLGGMRSKWVTSNWQTFNFCTRLPADITANPPVGSGGNLALHHPAFASSVENSWLPAGSAFDGNGGTRWGSAHSDPQWIYVDLGSAKSVSKVILNWETAYGKAFQIQVSNDASKWTTVWSTTNGGGGNQTITFPTTSARYVRMYGTQRGTQWGYSLYEFQVWAN